MPARRTDPLVVISLAGLVLSIVLQIGLWVFWGGRLSENVAEIAKRQAATDAATAANTMAVADQKTTVAVLSTKLDNIAAILNTVNGKLDAKSR